MKHCPAYPARAQRGAMSLKFMLPLFGFIAMAILLGVGLTLDPRSLPSTRINKPAPDFNLQLLNAPEQRFSPQDYRGQRWILNVWASWCVGCRVEHPLLNQIAAQTNIPMVGLNYKDDPDNAKQWLASRGDPYKIIPADTNGDAAIDWGVYGVPETFVIDENGLIIYKHTGPITAQALNEEILPLFINRQSAELGGE